MAGPQRNGPSGAGALNRWRSPLAATLQPVLGTARLRAISMRYGDAAGQRPGTPPSRDPRLGLLGNQRTGRGRVGRNGRRTVGAAGLHRLVEEPARELDRDFRAPLHRRQHGQLGRAHGPGVGSVLRLGTSTVHSGLQSRRHRRLRHPRNHRRSSGGGRAPRAPVATWRSGRSGPRSAAGALALAADHPDHERFVSEFWESYTQQAVHFAANRAGRRRADVLAGNGDGPALSDPRGRARTLRISGRSSGRWSTGSAPSTMAR